MKHTLRFLVTALVVLTCWIAHGAEPMVSNVRAAQRAGTKLVDVYYDLSGADTPATVAVAVSSDGGSSYAVPAASFTGDVGGGVANGGNKHVVWNAAADWNGQFSQTVKFRITATTLRAPPDGFALIPAGDFIMGNTSSDSDVNARPVTVYVSAFYLAKHEVAKSLWDEVRIWGESNGYTDLPLGGGKAANHPVHSINWYAMVKWCNARSQKEGFTPCYTLSGAIYKTGGSNAVACNWSANGYRLPTEAEWERAARGGVSGLRFPWGDTITHSQANYLSGSSQYYDISPTRSFHPSYNDGTSPYTAPVGSFGANGYGLHDMAGNVMEWCWDWYIQTISQTGSSNPRGPDSGTRRVLRGGSWNGVAGNSRASFRSSSTPDSPPGAGFRPARSLVP